MPAPLEQLLVRRCGVRYRDAREIVAEARERLGMPSRGPWDQRLYDECMKQVPGGVVAANSNLSATAALETPLSAAPPPPPSSSPSQPASPPESSSATKKLVKTLSSSFRKGGRKKSNSKKSKDDVKKPKTKQTAATKPVPTPVNLGKFQQPKRGLLLARSSSDDGLSCMMRNASEQDVLPIRPHSMRASLRREAAPLWPGSQRGGSYSSHLTSRRGGLYGRRPGDNDDDDDDDTTDDETNSSCGDAHLDLTEHKVPSYQRPKQQQALRPVGHHHHCAHRRRSHC